MKGLPTSRKRRTLVRTPLGRVARSLPGPLNHSSDLSSGASKFLSDPGLTCVSALKPIASKVSWELAMIL